MSDIKMHVMKRKVQWFIYKPDKTWTPHNWTNDDDSRCGVEHDVGLPAGLLNVIEMTKAGAVIVTSVRHLQWLCTPYSHTETTEDETYSTVKAILIKAPIKKQ